MEFLVRHDRPGILGDIASFLSLMDVKVIMFNGIAGAKRGLLLECKDSARAVSVKNALAKVNSIELTAFRKPDFIDRISLKHGRIIHFDSDAAGTYSFVREDLGILVDFLGELISKQQPVIGLRGMPRVGKTEAAIAACVYANKKWVLISSTLMRQTMRRILTEEELAEDCVYLIDGIVSCVRGSSEHKQLVDKIIQHPVPKIIEHPDIFLREKGLSEDFFDYIIELRRTKDEVIDYNLVSQSFSAFDIS